MTTTKKAVAPRITGAHKSDLKIIADVLGQAKLDYDLCDSGFQKVLSEINSLIEGPELEVKVARDMEVSGFFTFVVKNVDVETDTWGYTGLVDDDAVMDPLKLAIQSLGVDIREFEIDQTEEA